MFLGGKSETHESFFFKLSTSGSVLFTNAFKDTFNQNPINLELILVQLH